MIYVREILRERRTSVWKYYTCYRISTRLYDNCAESTSKEEWKCPERFRFVNFYAEFNIVVFFDPRRSQCDFLLFKRDDFPFGDKKWYEVNRINWTDFDCSDLRSKQGGGVIRTKKVRIYYTLGDQSVVSEQITIVVEEPDTQIQP